MKKAILAAILVVSSLTYVFYVRAQTTTPALLVTDPATVATDTSSPAVAPTTSSPTPVSTPTPVVTQRGKYKDGTYTGSVADAYYGNIQVAAVISGGKLTKVNVLQYPNDRHDSISINRQALPMLIEEAITAQSAQVDTISGATDTSDAFQQSLGSALQKAKA